MKKILIAILGLVGAYVAYQEIPPDSVGSPAQVIANNPLERAISERRSAYQVQGSGRVTRVLSDDNDGSRHQRFILELESGQTLLVAHNIDVAPRVRDLGPGDRVSFYGVYEWNERGGVLHWTHHDPGSQHIDGWLEHKGRRYE